MIFPIAGMRMRRDIDQRIPGLLQDLGELLPAARRQLVPRMMPAEDQDLVLSLLADHFAESLELIVHQVADLSRIRRNEVRETGVAEKTETDSVETAVGLGRV